MKFEAEFSTVFLKAESGVRLPFYRAQSAESADKAARYLEREMSAQDRAAAFDAIHAANHWRGRYGEMVNEHLYG